MIELARTLFGRLWFGNNELATEGFGPDAVKNRVAAQPGYGACISFNAMREDGQHDENAMIRTIANSELGLMEFAELVKTGPGEQDMIYARRIAPDSENGGRMTIFYYLPVKYLAGPPPTVPIDPPPIQPPIDPPPTTPPGTDTPTAILVRSNCTGDLADITTPNDGRVLRANSPSLDVRCVVSLTTSAAGTLYVELFRNEGGSPAPYAYVYVDDVTVTNAQVVADRLVLSAPIAAGVHLVAVAVAAQNGGSCNIGAIYAIH